MKEKMKYVLRNEDGMTMIELLATVVILAIIAGIGVVAIGNVIQNSREDAMVSNVQQAMNAANMYLMDPSRDVKTQQITLDDVIKADYLKQSKDWDAGKLPVTGVVFNVDATGNLTLTMPEGQLMAGKVKSKAISGMKADDIAAMKRGDLFNKTANP